MAKRKTKRFGSPPEVHAKRELRAAKQLKSTARQVRKDLDAAVKVTPIRNCWNALQGLTEATELLGNMRSDHYGRESTARSRPLRGQSSSMVRKLRDRFKRVCLKGEPR